MAIFRKECYSHTWHGPCDQGYETTEVYYETIRPKSYVVDGSKIKIEINDDTLIWDVTKDDSQYDDGRCITVRSYMTDKDLTLVIDYELDDSVVDDILAERDKIIIRKTKNDLFNKCKGFMRLKGYENILTENVNGNHITSTITLIDGIYRTFDASLEKYCCCSDCPHKDECVRFCDNIISALNTKKELAESCIRDIDDSVKPDEFLNEVIKLANEKLFKNGFDLESDESKLIVDEDKIQLMKLKNTVYGVPCYELLEIELDDMETITNVDLKLLFKGDSPESDN